MSNRSAMRLIVPATVLALLATACSSSHTTASTSSASPSASHPSDRHVGRSVVRLASGSGSTAASTAAASSSADHREGDDQLLHLLRCSRPLADLNKIVAGVRDGKPRHHGQGADRRVRRLLHEAADRAGGRHCAGHVRARLSGLRELRSSGSLLSLTGNAYDPRRTRRRR